MKLASLSDCSQTVFSVFTRRAYKRAVSELPVAALPAALAQRAALPLLPLTSPSEIQNLFSGLSVSHQQVFHVSIRVL